MSHSFSSGMQPPVESIVVPSIKGLPLIGHLRAFKRDMLGFFEQSQRECGDMFLARLAGRDLNILCHPNLAEQVLIKDKATFGKLSQLRQDIGLPLVLGNGLLMNWGESWRRQRQMMQPVFHKGVIAQMAESMTEAGERLLQRWQRDYQPGQAVDVAHEMMAVTMDIVCRTMFSTAVDGRSKELGEAFTFLIRFAFSSLSNPLQPPVHWHTPRNRAFRKALLALDSMLYGIIEQRAKQGVAHGDLLDMLLLAKDEETGQPMDIRQLRDEVATIFGAGHETTANALTWAWYLLSQHPAYLQRLQQELDQVLAGRTPTFADLPQLPYTRAVFEETLRLYPPAPVIPRSVLQDTELGGYALPKGSRVMISAYQIHRHRDFWPNPNHFDPDRFLPANQDQQRHRAAYMPFGLGPRVCIGNHFALMEGQLLLAQIAQRYDLKMLPGHKVEKEVAVTMRPKYGMLMTLTPRH
ncbi:MAG: cytochrome P450 [Chitinivorax sp.]